MRITLIKRIDDYCKEMIAAGVELPGNATSMRISAINSYLIYGTSFSEYFAYRFWQKSINEKRQYMTRRHMNAFFDKYNPPEYRERIGNKGIAEKYYGEYLRLEQYKYTQGKKAFIGFCKRHNRIFVKKAVGWGGDGAYVRNVGNMDECLDIYNALSDEYVVEPCMENCDEIKKLHPDSFNTIKLTTLIVKGKPEIQFALLRVGNNTNVDNVHSGGLGMGVNIENGIVETPAYDKHFMKYYEHPMTKERLFGFKIPDWEEVRAMALQCAMVTPEIRYASWDIGVTPNGPVLLEGNWDAEFYAEQMIYGRGNRKFFEEKLGD